MKTEKESSSDWLEKLEFLEARLPEPELSTYLVFNKWHAELNFVECGQIIHGLGFNEAEAIQSAIINAAHFFGWKPHSS